MQEKLAEICETLDKLVQNPDARIYASGQHALDESLVFGTSDAYLRFASELVKFIAAAQRDELATREIEGVPIQTSGSISSIFDSCSEIRFDNADLVPTEADARTVFEYWWDSLKLNSATHHKGRYPNHRFINCDFTGVELTNCRTEGMTINGIPLQDLLDKQND